MADSAFWEIGSQSTGSDWWHPHRRKADDVGSRDRKDKTSDREFLPSGGVRLEDPNRLGQIDSEHATRRTTPVFLITDAQLHFRCRRFVLCHQLPCRTARSYMDRPKMILDNVI